jgi:hypothetical protein
MNAPADVMAELTRLAATGIAVIVGTCDGERIPELTRAWGVRVSGSESTLDVCIYAGSGRRTLANLAENSQATVTIVSPSTYRSFQVKGHTVRTAAADQEDAKRVGDHQRAFVEEVALVGLPPEMARRLFQVETEDSPDLMTIRIHLDTLFDQTPGPGAGARL